MGNYDKYICTTLQKRDMLPGPNPGRDRQTPRGRQAHQHGAYSLDR